jgi:mitochondrial cardiolipin hydrolase
MADAFKQFLERNRNKQPNEYLSKLTEFLQSTTSTTLGVSKLIRQVFEVASSSMSEEDKITLKWAETIVNQIQSTCLRPVPKVRDTLFFPDPQSETKLIRYLDSAKTSMQVCVFTITNNNLRDALIRAYRRQVDLQIISDDECMKQQGSDVQNLRDIGIPTEIDNNPDAHMHNKFVVIDREILITGSFNWTIAAVNSNQENLVVIHDPEICEKYIEYFTGLWKNFRPVEVKMNNAATKIQSNYRGSRDRKKLNT